MCSFLAPVAAGEPRLLPDYARSPAEPRDGLRRHLSMRMRLFAACVLVMTSAAAVAALCSDATSVGTPLPAATRTAADPAPEPTFDGERTIPWDEALRLITSCEVTFAFQAHSLDVSLTLRDGTHVKTVEPAIDERL